MSETNSPSRTVIVVSPIMDPEPNYLKNLDFWTAVRKSLGAQWAVHLVVPRPTRVGGAGFRIPAPVAGVETHRFRTVRRRPRTPVGIIAEYFLHLVGSLSHGRKLRSPDAVYAYQGNPATTLAAAALAKRHGCPLFVDVQDPWPQALRSAPGLLKKLERPVGRVYEKLLGSADRFIVPDQFSGERMRQSNPDVPITVVRNWSSANLHLLPNRATNPVKFVYAGRLGPLQPVEMLVRAFRGCEQLANSSLAIYGSGPEENKVKMACGGNVTFGGQLRQEHLGEVLSQSHFGLLPLAESAVSAGFNPQKLVLYYSYGLIPVAPRGGAVGQAMTEADSGIPVCGQGSDSWVDAMRRAVALESSERQFMSERSFNYSKECCSRSGAISQIADILNGAR